MTVALNLTNFLIAAGVLGLTLLWWWGKRKYKLPPGPLGVPLLGYIPFIDDDPFMVFNRLSEKYGNVFGLYLGRSYVVVVNDFESMKEAFAQNNIMDRPPDLFSFHPDGFGFLGASGKEWVEQRRYAMKALKDIGMGKSHWEELVKEEVDELMKVIESYGDKPFDVKESLSASVSNNITSLIFGKRLLMGDPRREIVNKEVHATTAVFGQSGIATFFPVLVKYIAMIGITKYAEHRKAMTSFNQLLRNELKYHKNLPNSSNEETFMSGYLKEIEESKKENENSHFTESNLVGSAQALVLAGSETSTTSLLWLMLAIASRQDVQKKVDEEIRNVLGRDGRTNWMDRFKMPYTFATIMESQRWRTVVPLGVLHSTSDDTKVNGYDIPKGARIIPNIWAIHNDPKYWKDPERFNPERFIDENGQLKKKKSENFAPFSTGRRSCPGEVVALIEIFHYFTSLIQNFQILPPSDGKHLNLKGINGGTYQPVPQKLRFIPK